MKKRFRKTVALMIVFSMCLSLMGGAAYAGESLSGKTSDIQIVQQGGKQYYLADPQEGDVAGPENFDVWTSKTIAGTENEDEFEVTLQVGTTIKPVPNDVAVVLVMDASGSMTRDKNGKQWSSTGKLPTDGTMLRIDYAREAALEFANQLVENSGGAERMVSLVEFGNNAMTVLPWTNANDNGMLHQSVADAISSVNVNFVYDNGSFWDEEFLETWTCEVKAGEATQSVKAENWSDELYTHETKSFFEANFASYEQSFMSEYVTTMVTEIVEDVEATHCTYEGCVVEGIHTHCAVDGCTDSATHSHCTYSGCTSTEVVHAHCTYEGCVSDVAGHKHCGIAGCDVIDAENPTHSHCAFAGCTETAEHTHCTYSICSNPAGHKHCERACWCEEDHAHCKDIQDVCGRTDEHQHITGCTVLFCQDTTPNHKHACLHGAVTSDKEAYKYPFYVCESNTYLEASARCLNSDSSHTHDVYDGDSYRDYYDDPYYMSLNRVYGSFCTNLEGGLMLARNLLNTGMADGGAINGIDDVYVILLSDGCPTYHVNQELLQNADTEVELLPGERGGASYSHWNDLKDIVSDGTDGDVAIAEDIKAISDFYAIMYGTEMGQRLGYTSGGAHYGAHDLYKTTALEWFQTANDPENGKINYVGAHEVFISTEADELNTVFANINKRIDVMAKAWIVNDAMSSDMTFDKFTLNGEYAGFAPASASKDASVSWSLGNMTPESGNGTIADPYIYTLKYMVKLNSSEDDVKEASLAHDAGAALEGIWTGNNTSLQYLTVEKETLDSMSPEQIQLALRTADFTDVSVKGIYGDLTFVKKHGETGEVIEGAGFTLYTADGRPYGSETFSDSEGRVIFTDIPKNSYTLKETTAPLGMQKIELGLVESWGEVTLSSGEAVPEEVLNWPFGKEPDPLPPDNPPGGDNPTPPLPSDPPTDEPPVTPPEEPEVTPETPDVPAGGMEADDPLFGLNDDNIPLEGMEALDPNGVPKTADESNVNSWMLIAFLSGMVLAVSAIAERRQNGHNV